MLFVKLSEAVVDASNCFTDSQDYVPRFLPDSILLGTFLLSPHFWLINMIRNTFTAMIFFVATVVYVNASEGTLPPECEMLAYNKT